MDIDLKKIMKIFKSQDVVGELKNLFSRSKKKNKSEDELAEESTIEIEEEATEEIASEETVSVEEEEKEKVEDKEETSEQEVEIEEEREDPEEVQEKDEESPEVKKNIFSDLRENFQKNKKILIMRLGLVFLVGALFISILFEEKNGEEEVGQSSQGKTEEISPPVEKEAPPENLPAEEMDATFDGAEAPQLEGETEKEEIELDKKLESIDLEVETNATEDNFFSGPSEDDSTMKEEDAESNINQEESTQESIPDKEVEKVENSEAKELVEPVAETIGQDLKIEEVKVEEAKIEEVKEEGVREQSQIPLEYVSPPETENQVGRGLIYSCVGKHWVCVDRDAYFQCRDHQLWSSENKKRPECVIDDVYESNTDCFQAQTNHINNVEVPKTCK